MFHPFKHFWTITKHRHKVIKYCFKVGIGFQGLFHDLSKYSWTEFTVGAKYYAGSYSPNANERKEKGYSLAWMHHKGRNKHHEEYWVDIQKDEYAPVRMPIRFLKENLCDRIAASRIYLKKNYTSSSALEYFQSKNTLKNLHPETATVLIYWLELVAKDGETKALKEIKAVSNYEDVYRKMTLKGC